MNEFPSDEAEEKFPLKHNNKTTIESINVIKSADTIKEEKTNAKITLTKPQITKNKNSLKLNQSNRLNLNKTQNKSKNESIRIIMKPHKIQEFEEKKDISTENLYAIQDYIPSKYKDTLKLYNKLVERYERIDDKHRPFIVDLDSLLLDLFESPLIDISNGPQTLPLLCVLENRLKLFCGNERNVLVVIFECNKNLWKYSHLLFLREIAIYYLINYWQKYQIKINKKYHKLVFKFDHFWDDTFCQFIYKYLPSNALVNKLMKSDLINENYYYLMLFLTIYIISLDIPVILSSYVKYKYNTMYAFELTCSLTVRNKIIKKYRILDKSTQPYQLLALDVKDINKSYFKQLNNYNINNMSLISIKSYNSNNTSDFKKYLLFYSLINMFKNKKLNISDWDFVRLVLLHLYVINNIPLKLRAQKLLCKNSNNYFSDYFNDLFIECVKVIYDLTMLQNNYIFPFSGSSIVDCFDGRLLHQLYYINAANPSYLSNGKNLGLNNKALVEFEKDFNFIKNSILGNNNSSNITLYPIIQNKSVKLKITQETQVPIIDNQVFAHINDKFDSSVFSDINKRLHKHKLIKPDSNNRIAKSYSNVNKLFYKTNNLEFGSLVDDQLRHEKYQGWARQKYLAFLTVFARSLLGGRIILRDVVVSKSNNNKNNKKIKNKKNKNNNKSKKQSGNKSQNTVRENASVESDKKNELLEFDKVKQCINMQQMYYSDNNDIEIRINNLENVINDLKYNKSTIYGLGTLHEWCMDSVVLLSQNIEEYDIKVKAYPIIRLWRITIDIVRRFISDKELCNLVDIKLIKNMQKGFNLLGFIRISKLICQLYLQNTNNKKLKLKDTIVKNSGIDYNLKLKYLINKLSYIKFVLTFCGPYLIRNVGSIPDSRVDGYYPDSWQVKMLDIVDKNESALIVAPTSSGKTFVSYYAMKKVLQQNKNMKKNCYEKGIIIYVAPTKALVWQVVGDVYSKYGDVFGFMTKDFKSHELNAQVLICVPQTFEYVLLSSQREKLISNIKYVIFDEIHQIGNSLGGDVWQRILMLIDSPFLALSATIGKPNIFYNWLKYVNENNSYKRKIHFIYNNQRWSHLEKYIYLPNEKYIVTDNNELINGENDIYVGYFDDNETDFKTSCVPMHPYSPISLGLGLKKEDFSSLIVDNNNDDTYLSSYDCLRLYDAMDKYVNELNNKDYKVRLKTLNYYEFFKNDIMITRNKINEWQIKLKNELYYWSNGLCNFKKLDIDFDDLSGEYNEYNETKENNQNNPYNEKKLTTEDIKNRRKIINKVMNELSKDLLNNISSTENICRDKNLINFYSYDFVVNNITQLLLDLETNNKLPCIIFSLENRFCETLFYRILNDLETIESVITAKEMKEDELNPNNKSSQQEKREFQKQQKEKTKRQKIIDKIEKHKNRKYSKRDKLQNRQKYGDENMNDIYKDDKNIDITDYDELFEIEDYRFTFMTPGNKLDTKELSWWLLRIKRKLGWDENNVFLRGIDRGIGIHHSGLPREYKLLVETLFRRKQLKVVLSEGSLALGVNMPAKTIVFAGDSITLNPLTYKQMSGRAGRRGYDLVGHVIFFGISPRKISYLMTNHLLALNGCQNINLSHSLKLLQLYQNYKNKNNVLNKINSLFKIPLNYEFNRNLFNESEIIYQMKYKFKYSLQYQLHNNLINTKGKLIGLNGLVSYLSNNRYELDNYLFIKILESNYIHKLCQKYDIEAGNDTENEKNNAIKADLLLIILHIFNRIPTYYNNKEILLPKIENDNINQVINEHYATSKHMLIQYYIMLAKTLKKDNNNIYKLIHSDITIISPNNTKSEIVNNTLLSELSKSSINYTIRSPLVSISGLNDNIRYPFEFYLSLRNDIIISPLNNNIPLSDLYDIKSNKLNLNSYAYNFYVYGVSRGKICQYNNIRNHNAYFNLKLIQQLLTKIVESIKSINKTVKILSNIDPVKQLELDFIQIQKGSHQNHIESKKGGHYKHKKTGEIITAKEFRYRKIISSDKVTYIGDTFFSVFRDLTKDYKSKFWNSNNKTYTKNGPIGFTKLTEDA